MRSSALRYVRQWPVDPSSLTPVRVRVGLPTGGPRAGNSAGGIGTQACGWQPLCLPSPSYQATPERCLLMFLPILIALTRAALASDTDAPGFYVDVSSDFG